MNAKTPLADLAAKIGEALRSANAWPEDMKTLRVEVPQELLSALHQEYFAARRDSRPLLDPATPTFVVGPYWGRMEFVVEQRRCHECKQVLP